MMKQENKFYRGKAFVVGNDHYDQMKPDLDNAINDAKGIYDAFQDLGFLMMPEAYDIGIDDFDNLFAEFKSDLGKYEVGVLYYSGHGIEIEGKNYLIMKNTPKGSLADSTIRYSVDLEKCIQKLHDTKCKMIIVIIDACRNNPFEGKERGWGSVNLAPIFAPKGTLIAYSTSPGEKASDFGMEGHSVYTGALLKYLKEEGLEIETFFKKVRSTVDTMTGGQKTSWEHTSLIGSFSFNSGKMVHVDQLNYDISVLRDAIYEPNDGVISSVIKDLKSYNWFDQNDGVSDFLKLDPRRLDKNQLFIVGRNLLQAACGGSHGARDFILDGDLLCSYTIYGENHLFNGILFEIYFNKQGQFRYKSFKTMYFNEIMNHLKKEKLLCSFDFISNTLKEFGQFLMFVPSNNPKRVAVNVKLVREKVTLPWNDDTEMLAVKMISYEGYELMADELENNVFPYHTVLDVMKSQLISILCEGYAIPSNYLDLVFNEDPGTGNIWLNCKFRRNFRIGKETDKLDELLAASSPI